jgi:hypothetical protein
MAKNDRQTEQALAYQVSGQTKAWNEVSNVMLYKYWKLTVKKLQMTENHCNTAIFSIHRVSGCSA